MTAQESGEPEAMAVAVLLVLGVCVVGIYVVVELGDRWEHGRWPFRWRRRR